MAVKRIKSGGIYEEKVGYCRAVVAGGFVHVASTTDQGDNISENVVEQCRSAFKTISQALAKAGSSMSDVVRVIYMLPDCRDFEPCWTLLAKAFGENPPVGVSTRQICSKQAARFF